MSAGSPYRFGGWHGLIIIAFPECLTRGRKIAPAELLYEILQHRLRPLGIPPLAGPALLAHSEAVEARR